MKLSRRTFLIAAAAAAGVGCWFWYRSRDESVHVLVPGEADADFGGSNTWLHLAGDGMITIKIPSAEMGQGVHTGLAMIVAEELDADWRTIRMQQAPLAEDFNNPQFGMQLTGGSTSIRAFWMPLRRIGASARSLLLSAAARHWQVDAGGLNPGNGRVMHADGRSLSYGELAGSLAALPVPDAVPLKSPADFRIVGRPRKRLDTPAKVNGSAKFGIDVMLPDMLVATVQHSPVFGGEPDQYDEAAALAVPGVHAVVPIPNGIAVVGDGFWQAQQGMHALKPSFSGGAEPALDSKQISARLRAALDDAGKRVPAAAQVIDVEYEVPFLAHATLEPMNCTAHVKSDRCDIWVPTQAQTTSAKAAMAVTGLPQERIFVHTTYLGGGFGRRSEADFVVQAVTIAQAVGKPVKLIWSREEDMQHDFYRPACVSRFQIGLDRSGTPVAWYNQFAAPSIFKRIFALSLPAAVNWFPLASVIGDPVAAEGAAEPPYVRGEHTIDDILVDVAVPVGFWRSVGHSYNAFFVESVIDEAAHLAGADPVAYRLAHLSRHPREHAVLKLAAERAGWGAAAKHRFQGVAVHQSFGSYVAQVVELSVDDNKAIVLHKITCVADCGTVINPDAVKAQMESGIVYGLAAAASGEITLAEGRVQQSNFHDYPITRINGCSPIHVVLIESGEPPGGAGEPGTPPIAPALTNAIFAATGERLRALPISKSGYRVTA